MSKIRVSIIQNNAKSDWRDNLDQTLKKLNRLKKSKTDLITLPEAFCYRGSSRNYTEVATQGTNEILKEFKGFARQYRKAILIGSHLEPIRGSKKFFNTSILISKTGKIIARYRKIHLFDNTIRGASVRESKHLKHGDKIVSAKIGPVKVGLSICYDLRFPELYRNLSKRGCKIIFVPANFTEKTGVPHWEVLLRARAIENQVYIVAPGQVGVHPSNGIRSYGSSLVVDPWGKVLYRASRQKEEIATLELNFRLQKHIRRVLPALRHRKL